MPAAAEKWFHCSSFHLPPAINILVYSLKLNKNVVKQSGRYFATRLQSACQQFLLGSRELFIAQRARIMELGELLYLGRQICRRRLLNRSCVLRRGWSILLGLRVGCALLICLIILLLLSRFLLRIFLLLVVVDCTGSANHDRRAYGSGAYTSYRSSHHCSSA
jgi:hypothetical protein